MNFFVAAPPAQKTARELVSVCMVMQHGVGPKNLLLHAAYRPRSIVLIPLRAPTKVGEHSGLVPPYRVKQAAKRQAKQCTALFCAAPTHFHHLTGN
jgi:hypothetical protein